MKKKHRDITVGGVKYGWIAEPHQISNITKIKLYKDKKLWFDINTVGVVTPSLVREFIEVQIKRDNSPVYISGKKETKSSGEWKKVKS